MNTFNVYNEDCISGMDKIPNNSIDCILTDPPYKYLLNQKLETDFDEVKFFAQCKRVLTKNGFIILFGRGSSFYRWNTVLHGLGFNFKEEIVWNKSYCTSPLMAISRVHETVSIHSKGNGIIKKIKVPYLEMKGHDIDAIITDIKRLKTSFKNTKSFDAIISYLENNYLDKTDQRKALSTTISSLINIGDRSASVMQGIVNGMNEKTIIKQIRDHYDTIHPTQKPVRLLERLLQLVVNTGANILDPFSGSCSTGIAASNLNINFTGFELDKEYYDLSMERVKKHLFQPNIFQQLIA